jgi:predicted transcriptional regulator
VNEVMRDTSKRPQANQKKLSWEEKEALCRHWKESGLNKSQFCKKEKIPLPTFCEWCNRVWPREKNKTHSKLIPVRIVNKQETEQRVVVELSLSNQSTVKISVPLSTLGMLIKELSDATTTLR